MYLLYGTPAHSQTLSTSRSNEMLLLFRTTILLLFIHVAAPLMLAQLVPGRAGRLDRSYANNGVALFSQSLFFGDSLVLDDGSLLQLSTARTGFPTWRLVIELRKIRPDGAPEDR